MASLNRVTLIGNLCADIDMRYSKSGTPIANMRLATNESWTDKSGQRQEKAEYHRVVIFGAQAENCSKYLSKGRSCCVEGSLQTNKWTDNDGNDRYTTEIKARRVIFLSGGNGGGGGNQGGNRPQVESDWGDDLSEDSIPF